MILQMTCVSSSLLSMVASDHDNSGITAWSEVFRPDTVLDGQVFALEILERPVRFERRGGVTTMYVDRRGCREGIYTTRGKGVLVERSVGAHVAAVQEADKALHRFMIDDCDGVFEVEHDGLRWASGGVLSVVRWRGRMWTPFFFRDIPPFGWNISLGGSDKGDDLTRPEAFIEREFLEETLVLDGPPVNGRVSMRPFVFHGRDETGERKRSLGHARDHIELRRTRDGLHIDDGRAIDVSAASTRMRVSIRDDKHTHEARDVLVCMNRLEAAIEVVRALHFEMNDTDLILDGELLEPAGASAPPDLIRMPVAMISHDYLARAFGAKWADFEHEGVLQPSVVGPALEADEIVMFTPDVERRRHIYNGEDDTATAFEHDRYADWTARFGGHFYDDQGRPVVARSDIAIHTARREDY